MSLTSKKDVRARQRALQALRRRFMKILHMIERGKPPVISIRKRVLANVYYDPEKGILRLGERKLVREFLDQKEAKKFMQTLLMAKIIAEALENDEYPTIRDLYYRGKHSIVYRNLVTGRIEYENTWDEQSESDSVIRDIEVFIDMLREEMLILSKEKGKVVGDMRIRSGDDVIDLSKMGHGAYAIEPTPDFIEFLDVGAEFVLIVEKDAVFQQLHRAGFWKKYKALLITSAGQPDRATRRFVRRLNQELKLPVYILTDSIPADEVVVVKDLRTGEVMIGPVEELIGKYFKNGTLKERAIAPLAVPSWNPVNGRIEWRPIGYAYRHHIKEKILRLRLRGRGVVRVTKAHSLFVFRNGRIVVEPAHKIKPGDYVLIAERLPLLPGDGGYRVINVARTLLSNKEVYSPHFKLESTLWLGFEEGIEIRLKEANEEDLEKANYVRLSRSGNRVPNKIVVDEEIAWVLGLFTAEGSASGGRYITFNLGPHEAEKAERLRRIIKERFGVEPVIDGKRGIRVTVMSRIIYMLFKSLGVLGNARTKRVPQVIMNSPRTVMLSYLRGLFDGDGSIDRYGNIVYSTRSPVLSKQVFLMLQSLGVNPSVTLNGKDIIIRIGKAPSRTPPRIYSYLSGRVPGTGIAAEPTYGLPISKEIRKELIRLMNAGVTSYSTKNKTVSKAKLALLLSRGSIGLSMGYRLLLEGDAIVAKVVSVDEEEYEGYVYDFAVPATNSFIGGYGVIYHNSDPYGWYIYSVFKIGSITLSYESERLATPAAKLIGVLPTDIFGTEEILKNEKLFAKALGKRSLPKGFVRKKEPYLTPAERRNYVIRAKPRDVIRAIELVGLDVYAPFKDRVMNLLKTTRMSRSEREQLSGRKRHRGYGWFRTPDWIREVGLFFLTLSKLEIEALTARGLKFLMDKYIPEKIQTGDWID